MKALFKLGRNSHFVLNDFQADDLTVLLKIQDVENPYRSNGEKLKLATERVRDLTLVEDDDVLIVGYSEEADKEQIARKIKTLEDENSQKWRWFEEEQAKVKVLTAELESLKGKVGA